ncbi:MAG TPA: thiamine pyrophosphate-binding protein [Acidobacteriaceae bacterium]|jgi:acetolactate synthase-1/2/3 large subunit|nr:thiamine pyrophosphate-binding protein [Acidobacteriaceae bacterium]
MASTIKLSDYVMSFIARLGVKHVYMLSGGGAMHLDDSLGGCTELKYVCNLHEQACAVAAEADSRVTNRLSAALVTTGPGGTNTVTGVAAAWLDSTPVLLISGQVKRADLKRGSGVRILGVQEIDIVSIVDSITKYAVTIEDPQSIRYHLEKAIHLALSGRRGPVWIDIPLDVQAAQIDPASLPGFVPADTPPSGDPQALRKQVAQLVDWLQSARRPVLLAGNGIRMAGAAETFLQAAEGLGIPVLTTWLGLDLIPDDHPLCFGRPGSLAPRGANFTLQNCDLLLIVGSRLDMAMTAYAHDRLARGAKKVMVDIDEAEIRKMQTPIHLPIVADAGAFLEELSRQAGSVHAGSWESWVARCREWKAKYPLVLPEHRNRPGELSMYHFSEVLSNQLAEGDVIVPGSSGFAIEIFLLCLKIKRGQRCFHNRGTGSMGLGLPAAVGAAVASGRRTVCVDGDGGFQMNIQELATVERLRLPIKFFIVNNDGYASIRASQTGYFHRLVGADRTSGVTLPDLAKVAYAYGLPFVRIEGGGGLAASIQQVLDAEGPVVCEVMVATNEERIPRASSYMKPDGSMGSKPLEDLYPFLPREVFLSEMIVPPLED